MSIGPGAFEAALYTGYQDTIPPAAFAFANAFAWLSPHFRTELRRTRVFGRYKSYNAEQAQ